MRPSLLSGGYLEVAPHLPWRWVEDGQVLAWRDGTTIAFRDEVLRVLEWLSPQGLPPFGSVVLVLAACRGKIPEMEDLVPVSPEVGEGGGGGKRSALAARAGQTGVKNLLELARRELLRLAELPKEWVGETRGKCALLDLVFEKCADRCLPSKLLPSQTRSLGPDPLPDWPGTASGVSSNRSTLPLAKLVQQVVSVIRGYDEERLLRRLRTGLESIPQGVEVGIPAWRRARTVMDELELVPEFRSMARLAKNLMAAVQVPRRLARRDPLSIGGVADLSNRGPIDRLLLSELAHDDMTLMSRIALGEALYVRREPPSQPAPGTLVILLDQGLRMWGLPRVFAVAAALAIAARGLHYNRVLAWKASGHEIQPIDLLSKSGVEQCLSQLELDAHPGAAIPAFKRLAAEHDGRDCILLTHLEVARDPGFRKALASQGAVFHLLGLVDRTGRFELHGVPMVAHQPLCESHLDLKDCLVDPGEAKRLQDGRFDRRLPAFLHHAVPPLLLPADGPVNAWVHLDSDRIAAVVNERQLVELGSGSRGCILRAARLPGGSTHWIHHQDQEVMVLRSGSVQKPFLLVKVRDDGSMRRHELAGGAKHLHAFHQGEALVIIREEDVLAFGLRDGRPLDRMKIQQRWHNGRYFSEGSKFHVLTWDGSALRMEPLEISPSLGLSRVVAVFDRAGHEGPWILNQHCQVVSLSTGEKLSIPLPLGQSTHWRDVQVSRDGQRIYTAIPQLQWYAVFDLGSGRQQSLGGALEDSSQLEEPPPLPRWDIWKQFVAMRVVPGRGIQLLNKLGVWMQLEWDGEKGLMFGKSLAGDGFVGVEHGFHRMTGAGQVEKERGCRLEVAEWGEGHRAVLDDRGLLHLRSGRDGVPEMTVVLAEGEVAMWSNDQRYSGPSFFIPEDAKVDRVGMRWRWLDLMEAL